MPAIKREEAFLAKVTEDIMTTETRVGIVAGLMIVVAASVYFFYGNSPDDDSILVSTPTRVSLPPKIPPAADLAPSPTDKKGGAPQRITRAPRRTPTAPSTDQLAKSDPTIRPIRPNAFPKQPAADIAPAGKAPDTPIILRTAPSPELVEATKDNLREKVDPIRDGPRAKSSATSETTAPRGSPIVATRSPEVINLTPTRTDDSASPANKSLREMPFANWGRSHTVVEGDTLSDISKQYFGDASRVDEILAANPQIKSARHLKIGDVLTVPELKDTPARPVTPAAAQDPNVRLTGAAPTPAPSTGRTYTVQSGDTLYSIARKQFGDSKRWEDIFRLNKDLLKNNPTRLAKGMVLKLPE